MRHFDRQEGGALEDRAGSCGAQSGFVACDHGLDLLESRPRGIDVAGCVAAGCRSRRRCRCWRGWQCQDGGRLGWRLWLGCRGRRDECSQGGWHVDECRRRGGGRLPGGFCLPLQVRRDDSAARARFGVRAEALVSTISSAAR